MTDNERTVFMRPGPAAGAAIRVTVVDRDGSQRSSVHTSTFRIGRDSGNEVCLQGELVSRRHAEISFDGTRWHVRDLASSNGTYLNGFRIQAEELPFPATLQFGATGPVLQIVRDDAGGAVADRGPVAGGMHIPSPATAPLTLTVTVAGKRFARQFTDDVTIGREEGCSVCLRHASVSRRHAEIRFADGAWTVRDLGSSNGTLLDGAPVTQAPLHNGAILQFGGDGPKVDVSLADRPGDATVNEMRPPGRNGQPESLEDIAQHYFIDAPGHEAGEHTIMVRRAFQQVRKRQSRRYYGVIGVVMVFLVASLVVGYQQYHELQEAQQVQDVAIEMFYNMKAVSLQVANIEKLVQERGDAAQLAEIESKRSHLAKMERQYDRFLEEYGVLDEAMSPEDRLIMRMARLFGECELTMPKGFTREVRKYIEYWKGSGRLRNAITRITDNGYAPVIYDAMIRQHMPPQFMYLALQESNFNLRAVGPKTRFGIAKGVWQFIPGTARDYGLRTGPLVELAKYDPRDDRFDFTKATHAAARFLRDIYDTDAQASGLLVMASYNWGPTNIRKRIRQMPENPRERNFWKLLEQHRIPKETYDYVFYIFSASVIGENPRLFGFDFDNPLAGVDT